MSPVPAMECECRRWGCRRGCGLAWPATAWHGTYALARLQLDPGSNATRCGASSGDVAAAVAVAAVANEIFLQLVYFHTNDFDFRSDAHSPPTPSPSPSPSSLPCLLNGDVIVGAVASAC